MTSQAWAIAIGFVAAAVLEVAFFCWVSLVRSRFQWLITTRDRVPVLSQAGLKKFIPFGYDPELGWVRKPNTGNTEKGRSGVCQWSTNEHGARHNGNFEGKDSQISCYGDSFTFGRQVNNDETWEHYLSKLEDTNVLNFGVGNHGVDQSLIRFRREYPKHQTPIVIFAVVPDTISRIMSSWKHYYEYGNTFAFKPKYEPRDGKLTLIRNPIDHESKYDHYEDYLSAIQKTDYFYHRKFCRELIRFPYTLSVLKNARRNLSIMFWVTLVSLFKICRLETSHFEWNAMQIIMNVNLEWRLKLFDQPEATSLLRMIIEEYAADARTREFTPVFAFLPQKDDLLQIRKHGHFYGDFEASLSDIDGLHVISVTDELLNETAISDLYSDDNDYGGHFSNVGNQKVAQCIHEFLGGLRNSEVGVANKRAA